MIRKLRIDDGWYGIIVTYLVGFKSKYSLSLFSPSIPSYLIVFRQLPSIRYPVVCYKKFLKG